MERQGKSAQAEGEKLVREVFAAFSEHPCRQQAPVTEIGFWGEGLTDFEWIDLWASIYISELATIGETMVTKH